MRLMWLAYISVLIQAILPFVFFINVLKFKLSKIKVALILISVMIVSYILTYPIRLIPLIKPILMGLALYITIRKISYNNRSRIIIALIVAIGCSFLVDIFAYCLYGIFTEFDYSNAYEISVTRTTVSLFSSIFYFTITMTIAIFMNKVIGKIKKFCIGLLIVLPVSQILLLFGMYVNNYDNLNENLLEYGMLCLGMSIAVDLLIYFIINEYARVSQKEKEIEIERIHRQMELSYYQLAAKNEEEIYKLKHDIRNQLQAAYAVFDSDKDGAKKAKSIVKDINSKMEGLDRVYYCENPIINTILAIKSLDAKKANIKTDVQIGSIQHIVIADIDLCSIFTNLFDNAIEGCKRNKNKEKNFIKIKAGEKSGYLVIKFSNWCDQDLNIKNKKSLLTSKKDSINHGYGLKILEDISEKYCGELKLKYDDNIFETIIYLKINLKIY